MECPEKNMKSQKLSIHFCVFAVSLAILILQVSLARLLSVAQWYHFAFLVISIAFFGMGAAGTFLSIFPGVIKKEPAKILQPLTFAFSLSIILSFILANNIPFDPFRMAWDSMQIAYILVYYALLSIPFFFGGMVITIALTRTESAGRIYFSSLQGSGIGAVLVLPLSALGAKAIGISAFISALPLLGFGYRRKLSAGLLILLLLLTLNFPAVNISPYKTLNVALSYPDSRSLYTGWDARARVDLIESPFVRYAPGMSYTYKGSIPAQLGITVDGDQLTAITRWDGKKSSIEFVDYLPTSLPFHLNPGKTLILGAGGGLDILAALYYNSTPITAVEPNPMIADLMKKHGEFSGSLYERARLETGEGRGFTRKSKEKYDVILLTLAESTPASTGIYALTENYAYTVEAFQDYLERLSDNGILGVTRYLLPPPRESIRTVSLAVAAMEKGGIKNPERHIAAVRSWGTITILIKKSEFTPEETEKIREFSKRRKFDIEYLPGIAPEETNVYNKFPEPYYYQSISLLLRDREKFYEDYLFDVSPATDERPFFFQFFRVEKIVQTYESMGRKWQPLAEGAYLVPIIFLQALALSILFILLPLRRLGKYQKKRVLAYFLCIGLGFMFVEMALIQKFILFLGHPTYAVSAVLFSLLLSAGLGSFQSERLKSPAKTIPLLSLLIILYAFALPEIFRIFIGEGIAVRYLLSVLIISPLGFLMGFPFPLGIRSARRISPNLIPWAWAVNGCASVIGSILAIIIALSYGFSGVLALAGIFYLAAGLFMRAE